jgi:hypothetical protein
MVYRYFPEVVMGTALGRRYTARRYVFLELCHEIRAQAISMQCDRYLFSSFVLGVSPLRTTGLPPFIVPCLPQFIHTKSEARGLEL